MRLYAALLSLSLLVALVVVTLGAYVRLSDAGLGCPDWPGCYGRLTVPAASESGAVNEAFPDRPLESGKAWREMVHRYAAGVLGLLVAAIFFCALRMQAISRTERRVGVLLVGVVVFQALLGMWTVTLLLKPLVVVAHLAGGFSVLALLWWLWLMRFISRRHLTMPPGAPAGLRLLAVAGLAVFCLQVFLGGWTSSNYAALACVGFPLCNGEWLPAMEFSEGFVLWRGLGIDYEGGVLNHPARVAIHMSHRVGALVTAIVLGLLALRLLRISEAWARGLGGLLLLGLAAQILLGIGNVTWFLPLPVAVAHQGSAAILLLVMVSINYCVALTTEFTSAER